MKAVVFDGPEKMELREVDYPKKGPDDVIIKIKACGVCGTDMHIYKGDFLTQFPLIPGHEFTGLIEEVGDNVETLKPGDMVVVDNAFYCRDCYYCRINQEHFCLNFRSLGVTDNGGFAEFVVAHKTRVYKVKNLTFEEAAFTEPTSCALHGLKTVNIKLGDEVLLFGAGPVGLILLQLLLHYGASRVIVAAPTEFKLKLAKDLGATETVKMQRDNPQAHKDKIKEIAPLGFDVVIEATGSTQVLEQAFDFVKCSGIVHIFGVYPSDATIKVNPYNIFRNEIKVIGTFAQLYAFTPAIRILENKIIQVKPLITHKFKLDEFTEAMNLMLTSHDKLKIIIEP